MLDATCTPADIKYPTDIGILNDAREKTEKIIEHGLHTDVDYDNSKTAVYYCNTNNGYTRLVDGTTINSIENRMLIFDSKTPHTGSTCTDTPFRTVINFNYF